MYFSPWCKTTYTLLLEFYTFGLMTQNNNIEENDLGAIPNQPPLNILYKKNCFLIWKSDWHGWNSFSFLTPFYIVQIWKQKGGWHILHCMYLSSYNDSCMKSGDSISHILRFQDEKIFLQIKHNLHTHLYTRTHTSKDR